MTEPAAATPRGLGARLARNSFHSASGRVVAMLAWLVLTPPLVRALGPEGFGVWSLFYAFAGWMGSLDLGLSQVALRYGAAARARAAGAEAGEYATLAVLGYAALGMVWLVLVLLLRGPVLDLLHIHGEARSWAALAILVGAPIFVLSGITNTTAAVLQAWDRFDLANAVTVTVSLVQVAALLVALQHGGAFATCLAAVVAGWLAAVMLGMVLVARGAPGFRWSAPHAAGSRFAETLRFGMPLQAANAVGVMHQQVGKVLLVRMLSLAAVVPYELGVRVSTACATFAQLVLVAMIPEASVLHAQAASERLLELYRRAGRFVTGAAAIITAALVASAPALYQAWLGHAEPDAALALRGLAITAYAGLAGGISSAIARGVGRTSLELEWSGVALLLHGALGLLLVPRLGLLGALVAIASANLGSALWFAIRLCRAQGWPVGRALWEPFLLPGLAMAAGVVAGSPLAHVIRSPWLALGVSSAVAGVACLGVLFATRHLAWGEVVQLARRGVSS
ncbi:MAG TPA: lipopolysaccharide biosynthesis protein [Verrucomicrobiae bacterium]|nr:lipopolysaccharide biosynthesis protein [Verrucomicrobiae bacterium]